ncbi:hypothetical protein K7X08_016560 [Anisodus acutangulus]|uniref:EF-hand domain-containing protein n=1 Tax=Anisodus acutangulus TaxID=402998 RepID=A0A9Q1LH09_9SOLA|nr:hypothetical protein K7X08_016560 [Anisodus acutangulus]
MVEKLEVEAFVAELCGGFRLLAVPENGLITSASLQKNSGLLGMEGMSREDAEAMVKEGDLDGDGALNETEFCILMVRLSPEMMQDAELAVCLCNTKERSDNRSESSKTNAGSSLEITSF